MVNWMVIVIMIMGMLWNKDHLPFSCSRRHILFSRYDIIFMILYYIYIVYNPPNRDGMTNFLVARLVGSGGCVSSSSLVIAGGFPKMDGIATRLRTTGTDVGFGSSVAGVATGTGTATFGTSTLTSFVRDASFVTSEGGVFSVSCELTPLVKDETVVFSAMSKSFFGPAI